MNPNRLALAGLATLCVTAAAAGGYLAVRHNANGPEPEVLAAVPPAAAPAEPGAPIEAPVTSSPRPASATRPAAVPSRVPPPPRPAPIPERLTPAHDAKPAVLPNGPSVVVPMPVPAPVEAAPAARLEEAPPVVPEPPARRAEEVVVSAESVLGLKLETGVSSDRAKIEDRVEARVDRDVKVGGTVVIPTGSRVAGSVTLVEPGGRLKERARLGIRFHTLYLADGTEIPISTETVYRNGEERGKASAAKIGGGAAAGAILGAIIGGAKGAAIGGSVGAGAGTAVVLTGEPSIATFRPGTEFTTRILSPIPITIER